MTVEERTEAMREFCERHDFEFVALRGSQREPENLVVVKTSGATLKASSYDSLGVAVARMEQALTALGRASSDVYLHHPHKWMGRID